MTTPVKATLLYVEDDENLSFVTKDNLELEGYQVSHCMSGKEALQMIQNQTFDLFILDVMLPDLDGFTIAKEIRKQNLEVPILFLTAKSLKEDRINGLKIGGDDYITKPFSIEELILKINVFLRRNKISQTFENEYFIPFGSYILDYQNLELIFPEKTKKRLTQREADLLRFFLAHRNQVIRRSDILESVWGEDDYFLGRSLDVFISRLRKYLSQDEQLKIENIHGIGFQFKLLT